MEAVYQYLDALFSTLPQTEEMRQEKERMRVAAQNEYTRLREQGLSDLEASQQIMSKLQSVKQHAERNKSAAMTERPSAWLSLDQSNAQQYLQIGKTQAFLAAGGVASLICGFGLSGFLKELFDNWLWLASDAIPSLWRVAGIIVAVICFVQSDKKKKALNAISPEYVTPAAKGQVEDFLWNGFDAQKAQVIGVALCVAGIVLGRVFDSIPLSIFEAFESLAATLGIGAGAFVLVYRSGMKNFQKKLKELLERFLG